MTENQVELIVDAFHALIDKKENELALYEEKVSLLYRAIYELAVDSNVLEFVRQTKLTSKFPLQEKIMNAAKDSILQYLSEN